MASAGCRATSKPCSSVARGSPRPSWSASTARVVRTTRSSRSSGRTPPRTPPGAGVPRPSSGWPSPRRGANVAPSTATCSWPSSPPCRRARCAGASCARSPPGWRRSPPPGRRSSARRHDCQTLGAMAHCTDAELLGSIPITLFMRSGQLCLDDGRLSFRTRRTVVFDAAVGEIHSVRAVARRGVHLWHGDRRYRLMFGPLTTGRTQTGDAVFDAVSAPGDVGRALSADAIGRSVRDDWLARLEPVAGLAPEGLEVAAPWPVWAWWLAVVGATLVLIALITAVVLAVG